MSKKWFYLDAFLKDRHLFGALNLPEEMILWFVPQEESLKDLCRICRNKRFPFLNQKIFQMLPAVEERTVCAENIKERKSEERLSVKEQENVLRAKRSCMIQV